MGLFAPDFVVSMFSEVIISISLHFSSHIFFFYWNRELQFIRVQFICCEQCVVRDCNGTLYCGDGSSLVC